MTLQYTVYSERNMTRALRVNKCKTMKEQTDIPMLLYLDLLGTNHNAKIQLMNLEANCIKYANLCMIGSFKFDAFHSIRQIQFHLAISTATILLGLLNHRQEVKLPKRRN